MESLPDSIVAAGRSGRGVSDVVCRSRNLIPYSSLASSRFPRSAASEGEFINHSLPCQPANSMHIALDRASVNLEKVPTDGKCSAEVKYGNMDMTAPKRDTNYHDRIEKAFSFCKRAKVFPPPSPSIHLSPSLTHSLIHWFPPTTYKNAWRDGARG